MLCRFAPELVFKSRIGQRGDELGLSTCYCDWDPLDRVNQRSEGETMPESEWTASVEAPDPKVHVYLGYLREGDRVTVYEREQQTGQWRSIPEERLADVQLRKTLEWLADQASQRALTRLEGRWGINGPELT